MRALTGLPYIQVLLYIFGIRRYMDYATRLTGVKRKISWQSIREALEVEPACGRIKKGCPSKDQVRRAAQALERVGLVAIKSIEKQLIFECLLANWDKSVQNKPATKSPYKAATERALAKKAKDLDFVSHITKTTNLNQLEPNPVAHPQPAIHPVSGNITILSDESIVREPKRAHSFPKNFVVKPDHMDLALQNGWPDPYREIDAFRDYHLAHGSKMLDWNRAFYTWLRNAKRFGAKNHATQNSQFSRRSESVLRAYESSMPSTNWRG